MTLPASVRRSTPSSPWAPCPALAGPGRHSTAQGLGRLILLGADRRRDRRLGLPECRPRPSPLGRPAGCRRRPPGLAGQCPPAGAVAAAGAGLDPTAHRPRHPDRSGTASAEPALVSDDTAPPPVSHAGAVDARPHQRRAIGATRPVYDALMAGGEPGDLAASFDPPMARRTAQRHLAAHSANGQRPPGPGGPGGPGRSLTMRQRWCGDTPTPTSAGPAIARPASWPRHWRLPTASDRQSAPPPAVVGALPTPLPSVWSECLRK